MKMNEVEFISFAQMRRFATQQREMQIRQAASAAKGAQVRVPKGISVSRWAAMITSILVRGLPT